MGVFQQCCMGDAIGWYRYEAIIGIASRQPPWSVKVVEKYVKIIKVSKYFVKITQWLNLG